MRNGHYAPIHLHRQKNRHIDRHRDMENGDKREAIHPDAYLSGLVGWLVVGLVHFGSLWFGSDFFDLHKKIFQFSKFFS